MKKNPKSKRREAEVAAEWFLHKTEKCIVACRAIRTKYQRQDLFAADCIGKRADGSMVFAQATAGRSEAVRTRRRKLEAIPWTPDDTVMVLQLTQTPDPANQRRKLWFFRVHTYCGNPRGWHVDDEAVSVPREWFKAYKYRNTK